MIAAKPIDVEYFGHFSVGFVHFQPMVDVAAGVVTEERARREGIVHEVVTAVLSGSRSLWTDRSADEDAVLPVERLVDEGDAARATSTEDDGVDGHSAGILPGAVDRRALACRAAEPVDGRPILFDFVLLLAICHRSTF